MENTQKLKRRLIAAQVAIKSLLDSLDTPSNTETVAEEGESYKSLPVCVLCGEPILPSQEVRRERHARCYQQLYQEQVRPKLKTLAELEKEGLIGPVSQPGRKKTDSIAEQARKRIASGKKKKRN